MAAPALTLAELERFDPYAPDRGARERRFACPLPACAGKPHDSAHRALTLNTATGAWNCHRCGAAGKVREHWQERPRESRQTRARRELRRAFAFSEPPASDRTDDRAWRKLLRHVQPLAGTSGGRYLASRGIDLDIAHDAGARYSRDWFGMPACVFPVRDRAGNLVAAQGRYLGDEKPKVRSAGPIGAGVFITGPDVWEAPLILIVEAPIDALTLAGAGFPAVALCGAGNCPQWLPRACSFRWVLIALDGDAAGDAASKRLAAALRPLGARVERLRPTTAKDWNALRLPEGLGSALGRVLSR